MKKIQTFLAFILISLFFTACGKSDAALSKGTEQTSDYKDIVVENQGSYDLGKNKDMRFLGAQFSGQESVTLWANKVEEDYLTNVYEFKTDGSKELLVKDYLYKFGILHAYKGADGYVYLYGPMNLEKVDSTGRVYYTLNLDTLGISVNRIMQLENGRMFLYVTRDGHSDVVELNPETGEVSDGKEVAKVNMRTLVWVAAEGNSLLFMDTLGVNVLDLEEDTLESVMSFEGSSYNPSYGEDEFTITDFRLTQDGAVEMLKMRREIKDGVSTQVERIERVAVAQEKTIITMRGMQVTSNAVGDWLKAQITQFNQENDKYYIAVEECESGVDPEDYARLTSVEISTGKGPDILLGTLMEEYTQGLLEKGALENLTPYMEASGMKEEDYFPCAFSCWRDGEEIYGINFFASLSSCQIKDEVLGSREVPDIDSLMNALLTYEEPAVYLENVNAEGVLRHFLEGSESLWGAVDWEKKQCDFSGELFQKILEVAKRYGDDERNAYEAVATKRFCESAYNFDSKELQEELGMVTCGTLFEDGCYSAVKNNWVLAVNSNSVNKEAVWQFISQLLSASAQSKFDERKIMPVHKKVFNMLANKPDDGKTTISRNGMVIEKADAVQVKELIQVVESAKPLPLSTAPILDIICEEASDYFEGNKSAEEVIAVIENRVRLYLEEQR